MFNQNSRSSDYSKGDRRKRTFTSRNLIIGGAVLLLFLAFLVWHITLLNTIYWSLIGMGGGSFIVLALLVLLVARRIWGKDEDFAKWIAAGVTLVLFLGVFVALDSYFSKKEMYEASVVTSQPQKTATVREYITRAPLDVARDQTNSNVTINGKAEDTNYIASEQRFGALVRKPGITDGYGQIVYQEIGANGQSMDKQGRVGNQNCSFDPRAKLRFGGWFNSNLERAILHKRFGVRIRESDSYGYCTKDNVPMVIVPLIKYQGFPFTYPVPAGVAVYNGSTGDLQVLDEVKKGQFPGPVYPVSLARKARESTEASGNLWQYWMKSVGYADTTDDEKDPNADNASEFALRRQDKSGEDYVTPLVMKGRGSAITAISTIPSDEVKKGVLNKYQVNVLPHPRQANSAVSDKVHTDYSNLDWAAGIKVFEIAPTGPDTWTATLGRSKSIMYRLTINPDASSCLYDLRGTKLRCTNDAPTKDVPQTAGTGSSDLSALTNEQLIELQKQVQGEVEKRLKQR